MNLLTGDRVLASESCSNLLDGHGVARESTRRSLGDEGPSTMALLVDGDAAGFDRDELLERIIQQETGRKVEDGGRRSMGGGGGGGGGRGGFGRKTDVVRSNSYDECTRATHLKAMSDRAEDAPVNRSDRGSPHPCLQLRCHRGCERHLGRCHRHHRHHHSNNSSSSQHHHHHHYFHQQQEAACPHRRDLLSPGRGISAAETGHAHPPNGAEDLSKRQRLDLLNSIYEQVKMITRIGPDDAPPSGTPPPCCRVLPPDDLSGNARDASGKPQPEDPLVSSLQSKALSRPSGARRTAKRRRRSCRNSYPGDDPILPPPPLFDCSTSSSSSGGDDEKRAPRSSRPPHYRKFHHHRHSSGIEWTKLTKAAKREGSHEPPPETADQIKTNPAESTAAASRRMSSEPEVTPSDKADDKKTEALVKNNENVKRLISEMDLSVLSKNRKEVPMNIRHSHETFHLPPASIKHEPQERVVRCATCPSGHSYPTSAPGRDLDSDPSRGLEKPRAPPTLSGASRQGDSMQSQDLELNELLLSLQMLSLECDKFCHGDKSDDRRGKESRKMVNGIGTQQQHNSQKSNKHSSNGGVCAVTLDSSNNNNINNNNNNNLTGECQNERCAHPTSEIRAGRLPTQENGLNGEVIGTRVDKNKTNVKDRRDVHTAARHNMTVDTPSSPELCVVEGCAMDVDMTSTSGSLAELVGVSSETRAVAPKKRDKTASISGLSDSKNSGELYVEDDAEGFGSLKLFQADVLTVLTSSLCDDLKINALSCRDTSDSAGDVKRGGPSADPAVANQDRMKEKESTTGFEVNESTTPEVAGGDLARKTQSGQCFEPSDSVVLRGDSASLLADEKPKEKRKHRRSKRSYQRSKSLHRERSLEKHRAEAAPEGSDLGGSLRELAHLNIDVSQQLVDGKRVFMVKDASPELQVIVNSLTPVLSRRSRSRRSGHYAEHAAQGAPVPATEPEASERQNSDETSGNAKGTSSIASSEILSPLDTLKDTEHEPSARFTSTPGSNASNHLNDPVFESLSQILSTLACQHQDESETRSIQEPFNGFVGRVSGARDDLTLNHDDLAAELEESRNSLFMSPKLSRTWHGTSDFTRTRHRGGPKMGLGLTHSDTSEGGRSSAERTPRGSPSKETGCGSSAQQQQQQHAQTLPIISRTLLDAMHKRYCAHQYSNNCPALQPFTMLRIDPASTSGSQPITALRVEPCSVRDHEVHVAPPSPQFIARLRQLNSEFKANRSGGGGQYLHPRSQPPHPPHHSPEPQRAPSPLTPPRTPQIPARGSSPGRKVIQPPRVLHLTPETKGSQQGSPCELSDQDGTCFVDAAYSDHLSDSSPLPNKKLHHNYKQAGSFYLDHPTVAREMDGYWSLRRRRKMSADPSLEESRAGGVGDGSGSPDSTRSSTSLRGWTSHRWVRSFSERVRRLHDGDEEGARRRKLPELEAIEALKWLRAAGFPQYAQMFDDGQFPVQLSFVERDHDFLDADSLKSLFRRLETLNKYAGMKIHSQHKKKGTSEDDEDEEDLCALSERWEYQKSARRWSRKEPQSPRDTAVSKPLDDRTGSHDSLLADQDSGSQAGDSPLMDSKLPHSQEDSSGGVSPYPGDHVTMRKTGGAAETTLVKPAPSFSPPLRRSASEKVKPTRTLWKSMKSKKRGGGGQRGVVEISNPVVADKEFMQAKLLKFNCRDISPTSDTAASATAAPPPPHPGKDGVHSPTTPQSAPAAVTALTSSFDSPFGSRKTFANQSLPSSQQQQPPAHAADQTDSGRGGAGAAATNDTHLREFYTAHTKLLQSLESAQQRETGVVKLNRSDNNLQEIFILPEGHQPGRFPTVLQNGYIETKSTAPPPVAPTTPPEPSSDIELPAGHDPATHPASDFAPGKRFSFYDNWLPADGKTDQGLSQTDDALPSGSSHLTTGSLHVPLREVHGKTVSFDGHILDSIRESRSSSVLSNSESQSDTDSRNYPAHPQDPGPISSAPPSHALTTFPPNNRTTDRRTSSRESSAEHSSSGRMTTSPSLQSGDSTESLHSTTLTDCSEAGGEGCAGIIPNLKMEYEEFDLILQQLYDKIQDLNNYVTEEEKGSLSSQHPGTPASQRVLTVDMSSSQQTPFELDSPVSPTSDLVVSPVSGLDMAGDESVEENSSSGSSGGDSSHSGSDQEVGLTDISHDDSLDQITHVSMERRDSGVGHSLTRASGDRRRKKLRWNSFQKCHRPDVTCRAMQINSLTVSQLVRLQKLSLLKLTSIMEKYLPANKSGWNWMMAKFMKKKPPDFSDRNVFGVPFTVMAQRTGQPLPQCVLYAMRYLRRTSQNAVGIFRKSGVKSKIQQLRDHLEAHPETSDFEDANAYNVADMLKTYFRDLPECLLTNKMSETFRSIYTYVPQLQRLEAIQAAILLLPDENREVLQSILLFLSDISSHDADHQMNASNLAVCFTPTVFQLGSRYTGAHSPKRNRKNSPGIPDPREILEQKAAHECLLMMITECKKLFTIPPSTFRQLQGPSLAHLEPAPLQDIGNSPAEVKAFGQERIQMVLKEAHDKNRGWIPATVINDVEVFHRKPLDDCPLKEWKFVVEIEAPPVEVLRRIMHERHTWDEDLLSWSVLERLDPHSDIFQYVLSSMAPHPSRHYCVLRYWRSDLNKGACALVTMSVEHSENIDIQGVWAIDLGSYILMEPCGSGRSRVTYITRVDTRGRSPEWYSKVFGHVCANFLERLQESFRQESGGPETKV